MTASDVLATVATRGRRAVARVAKPEDPKADGLAPQEQFESPLKPGTSVAQETTSPTRTRNARALPSPPVTEGMTLVSATIHEALSQAAAQERGNSPPASVMAAPETAKGPKSKPSEALLQGLVSSDMLHRIRQRDKVRSMHASTFNSTRYAHVFGYAGQN